MELDFNNELDIDLSEYENLYNKLFAKTLKLLKKNENSIMSVTFVDKPTIHEINKTYRYVNLENLKNYIVIFIAGILSLVYSSLSDSISLNFILFHLFMYLTLSKNVAKIVEIVMHQEEYKYYKCLYKYYSME